MFTQKIGYPKKMATPKNWLPQKIDQKKDWLPQKIWRTLLRGGFIINFWKNSVLYFVLVY